MSVASVGAGLSLRTAQRQSAATSVATNPSATLDTLKILDTDGSGTVTFDEVKAFADKLGLNPIQTVQEFQELDINRDGILEALEISNTIRKEDEDQARATAEVAASVSLSAPAVDPALPSVPLATVAVATPPVATSPVGNLSLIAFPSSPTPAVPAAATIAGTPAAAPAPPPAGSAPAEGATPVAAAAAKAPMLAASALTSSTEALPIVPGALASETVPPSISVPSTLGPHVSAQIVAEHAVPAVVAPDSLAGSHSFALRAQHAQLESSASESQHWQEMTQAASIAHQLAALTQQDTAQKQRDQYRTLELDTYAKELRINATKLMESTPLLAQDAAQAAALIEITKSRQQVAMLEKQAHEVEEQAARLRAHASAAMAKALKARQNMVAVVQGLAADAVSNITATYSRIES